MAGANKRIQDLPPIIAADLSDTDVMAIVDVSGFATKKITYGDLKAAILADVPASDDDIKYYGDPAVNGSWREGVFGAEFKVQYREGGVWIDSVVYVKV